jgi:hypothetical protein
MVRPTQRFNQVPIQQNKKTFTSTKREMKAFTSPNENSSVGWPHPSLCGEVAEAVDG